jgi:hypothetical protein
MSTSAVPAAASLCSVSSAAGVVGSNPIRHPIHFRPKAAVRRVRGPFDRSSLHSDDRGSRKCPVLPPRTWRTRSKDPSHSSSSRATHHALRRARLLSTSVHEVVNACTVYACRTATRAAATGVRGRSKEVWCTPIDGRPDACDHRRRLREVIRPSSQESR